MPEDTAFISGKSHFGHCLDIATTVRQTDGFSALYSSNSDMLNKNTLGVKKMRSQSEAALQIGMCDQKL